MMYFDHTRLFVYVFPDAMSHANVMYYALCQSTWPRISVKCVTLIKMVLFRLSRFLLIV